MKDIKKFVDSRLGMYSFYFEDLNSGYCYYFNENVMMPAAGCMKLPIAISLLKEVEVGHVDIEDKVNVRGEDMVYGTGIIHEFGEREYRLKELLVAMLIQSDNTAANKIIDVIGMNKINKTIDDMGLNNTVLNRKTIDERMSTNEIQNYSCSSDLTKCWKLLYKSSFLNEEHSNEIINILKRQQIKNKITFYYPESTKNNVACKSGDIENIENDTAFINLSKGKFLLTVMSKELPNNVYGQITIARIGKMVLDIIESGWS